MPSSDHREPLTDAIRNTCTDFVDVTCTVASSLNGSAARRKCW